MTVVGIFRPRSSGVRSGAAMIAASWRAAPSGWIPRSKQRSASARNRAGSGGYVHVEVYGRKKRGVAYNQRSGRPHVATWAETQTVLAADLMAGNEDPRRHAPELLRRALAALPEPARPDGSRCAPTPATSPATWPAPRCWPTSSSPSAPAGSPRCGASSQD
jgi:hypothetical protein